MSFNPIKKLLILVIIFVGFFAASPTYAAPQVIAGGVGGGLTFVPEKNAWQVQQYISLDFGSTFCW
jgi:hypothetical protein